MQPEAAQPATQPQLAHRRIELERRTCIVGPDRIDLRPSRAAILPPLLGFTLGLLCVGLVAAALFLWPGSLSLLVLTILLLAGLFLVPLSGMGLVYAIVGANVIIDRHKQSATWQQGLLGLGIGTQELVPFWKIEAILVEEPGIAEGRVTEEFAQWEILLLKQSGKKLLVGRLATARLLAAESLARATEVAEAIAVLTGAPLRLPPSPTPPSDK
jgi:hypothetical protein